MDYCSPAGPLDEFHQRELEELRNLTVHKELRVAAAMDYCAEEGICAPPWLAAEAASLIRDLLKREKAQKRGRLARHIARYRQDLCDLERWDAVEAIRRIRKKSKHEVEIMRSYGKTFRGTSRLQNYERLLAWSRNGTFECASMYLTGRDAKASAETIRASYRRCNRRSGTGQTPNRYYLFDERFLLKLGFPRLMDRKPGTKWLPLYNLTP
jgi:hypothetical protein